MSETATIESPLAPQLTASHATFLAERPPGADEDVHMLSAVVDHIIERCSRPGDLILDPFAGFGTTIERAVLLGRSAIGVELLPERVDYVARRVPSARIFEGDARELLRIMRRESPEQAERRVKLILASPPYMSAEAHEPDALTAYEDDNGDYERYLTELGLVAAQCAQLLAPEGYLIWNVADILDRGRTTHLIRDCVGVVSEHLTHIGDTQITWDQYPHDLVADALIVFQR